MSKEGILHRCPECGEICHGKEDMKKEIARLSEALEEAEARARLGASLVQFCENETKALRDQIEEVHREYGGEADAYDADIAEKSELIAELCEHLVTTKNLIPRKSPGAALFMDLASRTLQRCGW